VNAHTLYRRHARLLLTGMAIQLPPLLLVLILTLHPDAPATLLLPLPAAVVTATVELAFLWRQYRPLRTLDGLSSEQRYAQNADLSRGVVLLHNLPLLSLFRTFALRGLLLSGLSYLLIAFNTAAPVFSGSTTAAYWLLSLTMVPLLPAAFEMLTLPRMIDALYQNDLSYRGALTPAWKHNILLAGTGMRVVFVICALCAAPLVALALLNDFRLVNDLLLLASVVLTIASFVAALLLRDSRRSVDALLDGMHQVGRNRPSPVAAVNSGDEFALAAEGFSQMVAGLKEQSFIRDTFGKYVPKAIVEAVLRNGVKLHGEWRTVAVALVNIHRFRSRFDRQPPVETVALLNQYLGTVTASAQHFGGTIDKVNGDRVLVVFGAPVTLNAPVERALFAALEVRKGIDRLNRRLEHAGCEPLRLSITVHYGPVIAGHVGAAERWEYSVIGQAVNDTYRVNEITQHHPVDIVATAAARRQAGEQFQFAGPLTLADGDESAWEVYSVVDLAGQPPS
jgi:adenylate cyclase